MSRQNKNHNKRTARESAIWEHNEKGQRVKRRKNHSPPCTHFVRKLKPVAPKPKVKKKK